MGYPGNQTRHTRKWTPEHVAAARSLKAETGLSYRHLANRLRVTKNQLIGAVWRAMQREEPIRPATQIKDHWFVGGCRWIFGEPGRYGHAPGNWRWCGAETEPGHTWCPEHEKIGWIAGKPHPLTIKG